MKNPFSGRGRLLRDAICDMRLTANILTDINTHMQMQFYHATHALNLPDANVPFKGAIVWHEQTNRFSQFCQKWFLV